MTGESEGAFYIEIKDGVLSVEPFDYNDRDFLITCDGAEILAVVQGKKSIEEAYKEGTVKVEGDLTKAIKLGGIIPKAKKTTKKDKKADTAEETPAPAKKRTRKTKAAAEVTDSPEEGQMSLTAEPEEKPAEKPVRKRRSKKTDADS